MIMDEMDLVGKLKEVPPLRPEAYERARATLNSAMAAESVRPSKTRTFRLGKIGIGLVSAAAVAVTIVAVTSPAPTTVVPPSEVSSKLMLLANDANASNGTLPGDASLVIRNQTAPDGKPYITYNLYTDSGDIYVTDTQDALPRAIARNDNLAEPTDSHVVAEARAAARGDIHKARDSMVNARPNVLGIGLTLKEAEAVWDKAQIEVVQIKREKGIKDAQPRPRPTGKALQNLIDNSIWTNSIDALARGAANPEVRAGVFRLISTIPDVTVTDTNTAGQPTLTITAGPALFQGDSEQILTIHADTGLPISSVSKQKSGPSSTETYQSSRVTLADIKAGKF